MTGDIFNKMKGQVTCSAEGPSGGPTIPLDCEAWGLAPWVDTLAPAESYVKPEDLESKIKRRSAELWKRQKRGGFISGKEKNLLNTERRGFGIPVEPIKRGEFELGRNESCPCGSGKKFKKCCIGKFPDGSDPRFTLEWR